MAQASGLGVHLHNNHVAAIGQADDVVLVSDDIYFLHHLLQLSLSYCDKFHVSLAAEKTKLVVFSTKNHQHLVNHQKMLSPIANNSTPIEFSLTAEHVGITRSSEGNLPHILGRISSHRKALFSIIPAGLSKRNNANPAATIRIGIH